MTRRIITVRDVYCTVQHKHQRGTRVVINGTKYYISRICVVGESPLEHVVPLVYVTQRNGYLLHEPASFILIFHGILSYMVVWNDLILYSVWILSYYHMIHQVILSLSYDIPRDSLILSYDIQTDPLILQGILRVTYDTPRYPVILIWLSYDIPRDPLILSYNMPRDAFILSYHMIVWNNPLILYSEGILSYYHMILGGILRLSYDTFCGGSESLDGYCFFLEFLCYLAACFRIFYFWMCHQRKGLWTRYILIWCTNYWLGHQLSYVNIVAGVHRAKMMSKVCKNEILHLVD